MSRRKTKPAPSGTTQNAALRNKSIRFVLESIRLAMASPERSRNPDLVSILAAPVFGDDCTPDKRFIGWDDGAVLEIVQAYLGLMPDREFRQAVQGVRSQRQWLAEFEAEQVRERANAERRAA